jgi:hypothetical protein
MKVIPCVKLELDNSQITTFVHTKRLCAHPQTLDHSKQPIYNRHVDLLHSIQAMDTVIKMYCNAGTRSTKMAGDLEDYGSLWFD